MLQSIGSTQLTEQYSHNVSAAANSTQFSHSIRYTYPGSTGPVGFTFDYSSSLAASLNFHSSGITGMTGNKQIDFQWQSSLGPGQYWLAYRISSTSSSQYTSLVFRNAVTFNQLGASLINSAFGTLGANTHVSVHPVPGVGTFTTVGGASTDSMPISAISSWASHNRMYFQLMRIA
jgi:hypothetical protein